MFRELAGNWQSLTSARGSPVSRLGNCEFDERYSSLDGFRRQDGVESGQVGWQGRIGMHILR